MISALIIGIGIWLIYHDLPEKTRRVTHSYAWLSHLCVFFALIAIHGGSAEGAVLAGIATIVFRFFHHRSAAALSKSDLRTAAEYNRAPAPTYVPEDTSSDIYISCIVVLGAAVLLLVSMM